MFGFSLLIHNTPNLHFTHKRVKNIMRFGEEIEVYDHMIDKFGEDKVFYQDETIILVIDGVILNKKSLETTYQEYSWPLVVKRIYRKHGEKFFSLFRGSFSGCLYDKQSQYWFAFSDHIGTKFMYYIKGDGFFFLTSYIPFAYQFLRENQIRHSLSVENAYLLLSYGYMIDDRTLSDSIFKINPGCYICSNGVDINEKQYFLLDNTPDLSIKEKDAIELMDEKFRKAIELQFEKDCEYGYKHIVSLSAGLDSRMVTWVSHEMGYTNQINCTFSQTGFWDETVPKQITRDLKHEWIFKSLDNGLWLYDIDQAVNINGGNVIYYGTAHCNSLLKYIDFSSIGLMHSGQQGDIAFDTYYTSKDTEKQFVLGEGAFSTRLLPRIKDIKLRQYKNEEIAHYYCRSFSGANHGEITYMGHTEVKSPFADIDVLSTILKIPLKYRMNRDLYFKWILEKYPKAGDYVWDHISRPISNMWGLINIGGKKIPIEQLPLRIINKIHPLDYYKKKNMNPLGYYLQSNQELMSYLERYYCERICLIDNSDLKRDIISIMDGNNPVEKIQALTLLSAVENFFE